MAIVAGVDSSTQSCTVELRDAETGSLLGSGRAPHPPTFPPVSEQAPSRWWEALRLALGAAIADSGARSSDIRALSIGAQCHGLVMLDAEGVVLRDAKLWNDTTSAPHAAAMVAANGASAWVHATGSVPTAAFTISKLAWVAEHEPHLLDRLARVLLPHDYLTWRLTGEAVTDRSDASGTGYYGAHDGRWRTDLLDAHVASNVDWSAVLPRVLAPSERAGTILPAVADELGLSRNVVIGAGGGDQHLGALGLGLRDGDVVYSLGTSGVVLTSASAPVFDEAGFVNGVADAAGGYLPLVCTLNSTKVTDWTARLLGVPVEELSALALAADPTESRPVFAAFLDGERTPNRPLATGLLGGLTTGTTREDLARAAFEGVVFGLARGHEQIRRVGAAADGAVTVTGGGARSAAYRQIIADTLDRPVLTKDAPEATARGAAVQAAAVLAGADVVDVRDAWAPPVSGETTPGARVSDSVRSRYALVADWEGADRAR
jgi:xylulokinase